MIKVDQPEIKDLEQLQEGVDASAQQPHSIGEYKHSYIDKEHHIFEIIIVFPLIKTQFHYQNEPIKLDNYIGFG